MRLSTLIALLFCAGVPVESHLHASVQGAAEAPPGNEDHHLPRERERAVSGAGEDDGGACKSSGRWGEGRKERESNTN